MEINIQVSISSIVVYIANCKKYTLMLVFDIYFYVQLYDCRSLVLVIVHIFKNMNDNLLTVCHVRTPGKTPTL